LPLVAASYGKRIPNRETPSKEAIAIYDELIENPEISRKYEREAIITPEYPFDETDPKYIVAVESGRDRDKFRKLDDAIEHSKFIAVLEKVWQNSGKSKEEFRIIIKSHFITMLAREETSVYVDPSLVLHLVRRIIEAGFPKVAVAEGRNSFGKWLGFRGVCRVAARAGYIDEDDIQLDGPAPRKTTGYVLANNVPHPFEIIDLGLNTEDYNFGGELLSFIRSIKTGLKRTSELVLQNLKLIITRDMPCILLTFLSPFRWKMEYSAILEWKTVPKRWWTCLKFFQCISVLPMVSPPLTV
jgi:hypothetical protein